MKFKGRYFVVNAESRINEKFAVNLSPIVSLYMVAAHSRPSE